MALANTDIASTLTTAQTYIISLSDSVAGWNGDALGAFPIVFKYAEAMSLADASTRVAQLSEPLTAETAGQFENEYSDLANYGCQAMDTIIAAKPKLDKFVPNYAMTFSLRLIRDSTSDFHDAFLSKVPADNQSVYNTAIQDSNDCVNNAIEVFKN